jgi:separase
MHVIQLYQEQPVEPPVRKAPRTSIAKPPPLVRYLHLIRYPLPPPKDAALVGVIGTSVSQALTALATLLCHSPGNGALEAFASTIEEDDGLIMWHSFLPREHADAVLTRAHRALAVAFTSSNAPPAVLFRLRTWALRCLLCKTTLDSGMFWTQATNYLVSHGKNAIKEGR